MPRMTSVLVTAVSAIGVAAGGLMAIGGGHAMPVGAKPALQDEINAHLYMSQVRDGEPERNFGTAASTLYAVVDYDHAAGGEQFIVQLRDLSGVVIKKQSLTPLTAGDGKRSVMVTANDFMASYRAAISVTQFALTESMAATVSKCQNYPPPPDTWPIQLPTPQPGQPTPTAGPPHPYQRWLPTILDPLDASTLTTSELSRTLQAVLGMPDLADGRPGGGAAPDFRAAQTDLVNALERLQQVPTLLQPPQVPEDGPTIKPDPARGCLLVNEAATWLVSARAKIASAVTALPADTTGWALPRTIASYKGSRLQACVQYNTDLYDVVGGQQRSTPADTVLWTVGDPGAPALIFPSPDQTDRGNAGNLRLTFPTDAQAVYAKSVTVPGVNHEAKISAYITDRNCLPIAGTKVAFAVDPSGYGTLSAAEVTPDQGVAEVTYTAGNDVPAIEGGRGQISVRADAGDIEAKTQFGIVGPAEFLRIIVNPKVIHRIIDKRGGVTVELKDKNGNSVADGTAVKLRLIPPSVGQLAYERQVPGQREPEVVMAGTSIDLITKSGRTIVPPSQSNLAGVYITADGRDGEVVVEVEADGKKANSNVEDETTHKVQATIFIVSTGRIFMPVAVKKNDGFPRATPIVTRTPRLPLAQSTPAP
ncbi:MAG: hypothetical protein ABI780_00990 [Ardenticatenales bacterium]